MRHKVVKARNAFGEAEYVDMVDLDGIIAITRSILKDDPTNERAASLIRIVDALDHKITDDEFRIWMLSVGVTPVQKQYEDYEN